MSKNNRNPFQSIAIVSAILGQLVGSVLLGIFSGMWLDQQLKSEPLFLLLFLFVGLGAGIYGMTWIVKRAFAEENKNE